MTTRLQNAVRRFTVEIGGEDRDFAMCLNYRALTTLCDRWGIELKDIDTSFGKMDVSRVPDVIYAAMVGFNENATEADAKLFCEAISVPDLSKVCSDLIQSSNPPAEAGGEPGPHQKRNKR